ncbi:PIN domain-containing protein [Streptomyces sp. SLBN-115]|uniref:PIN domain-containing protein n=1 Tax=Streptomyces sp. SLBN-115 TaxID=2768453 RepID=UPI001151F6C2|nr:PIN domain-containing protein [Streptomyces sp. SLBN-115]TQJ54653.1 PIN domain-containing protein [Streptomyces sp. SLBN-115]
MHLRNVGAIDAAELTLQQLKNECGNLRNSTAVVSARDNYLSWVEKADSQFRSLFDDESMADDLYSAAYWEIRRITQVTPRPYPLIHGEIENRIRDIEAALALLTRMRTFVSHPGSIVVPDTSAFIQGEIFTDLVWPTKMGVKGSVRLVVPIIVVEQLDRLKDGGNTRAGDRARKVLKRLRGQRRAAGPGIPAQVRDKVTVEIFLDDGWQQRHPIADDEIIQQALKIQKIVPHEITLACVDAGMEFRALENGLKVFEVPPPPQAAKTTI